jgi:hypothetical protein
MVLQTKVSVPKSKGEVVKQPGQFDYKKRFVTIVHLSSAPLIDCVLVPHESRKMSFVELGDMTRSSWPRRKLHFHVFTRHR